MNNRVYRATQHWAIRHLARVAIPSGWKRLLALERHQHRFGERVAAVEGMFGQPAQAPIAGHADHMLAENK